MWKFGVSRVFGLSLAVLQVAIGTTLTACGGAIEEPPDEDVSLPDDIEQSGEALTLAAEADSPDGLAKDEDREGPRHRHRHHHGPRPGRLFRRLDRLDGVRDHQITIAALPPRVPARLVERLHAIDTNADGVVTKEEARAAFQAWRDHHR